MSNASTDPWRLKEHEGNARSQSQSTVPECSSCSAMMSAMLSNMYIYSPRDLLLLRAASLALQGSRTRSRSPRREEGSIYNFYLRDSQATSML